MLSSKNRGCFILFLLLLLHNESYATTDNNAGKNVTIQHLPRVAIPVSYEIKLVPQIIEGNFTFHGESRIVVRVLEETSNVTLHSKNLKIDEHFTSLVDANGVTRKVTKHSYTEATSVLAIEFNKPITAGDYTLSLKYAGNMSAGIYNSSYVNEIGEKTWFVASRFFLTKARTAFPCWDEFDFKATFNLSIKHYPNVTAVSNMPVRNKFIDSDGKVWTNFDTTPLMPVHRLGFVVSDFHCLRSENNKLSFCGRKEFLPYLQHPLNVTERAIGLFEKYMDSKYNSPKLDQFAIPTKDKSFCGMQPWEPIKYEEAEFKKNNMLIAMQEGAVVVVQEVARDWIGSLVTFKSINSTWITEGLSNYVGYYIVDKLFPDWREMDVFLITNIQEYGLFLDGWDFYEPLAWFPNDPAAIPTQYSEQRFTRGGALFYMMSNVLTETTFKEGIRKFVKQHEYRTATSVDLWNALQSAYEENNKESSGSISIREVMKSWVGQIGYPIVNVTRNYETGKVVITQQGVVKGHKSNRYWIPINFATKTNPNFEKTTPTHWLKPEDESLIIDGVDKDDWIIINIQQSGYYRVDYDETNWKRIAEYMNTDNYQKIHVRNRAQLIDDLAFMTKLRRQNYTTFLDLVRYLDREGDYLPWYPTIREIQALRMMTSGWKIDEAIKTFFLGLIEKITLNIDFGDNEYYGVKNYKSNTDDADNRSKAWLPTMKYPEKLHKNDTFFTRRYGNSIKYTACSLGHPLCLESESNQVRAFYSHHSEIPITPGMFYLTRCDEIATGSENDMLKTMENSTNTQYVDYLLCSPDKNALRKFVDRALSGELNLSVRQMSKALVYLVIKSKNTSNNTIDYFIENFDAIYKYFEKKADSESAKSEVTSILNTCVQMTYTSEQMKKLIDLADKESNRLSHSSNDIESGIIRQTKNIQWRENNAPKISEWFRDHSIHVSADA